MRALKFIGFGLLSLFALLGAALGYTAIPPYDPPPTIYVQPKTGFTATTPARAQGSTVVVMVLDGLAPATVEAANTPQLDRIAREGAHTRGMLPVFPSLSMPNHFSLSTGCEPARHGVVGNHFRDAERGFFRARGDADWLLACEPLHVAAERQGVRSAVLGWVGNSSSTRGKLATVAEPYRSPPVMPAERVDQILEQLEADPPPRYVAAYSPEPDGTGHKHGPLAPETIAMVESIDAQIGRLLRAAEAAPPERAVHLVVTTDHGMIGTDAQLNVDNIVRKAGVDALVVAEGSIAFLHLADPSTRAEALAALQGGDTYDVFDPAAPPAYARIGTSSRVGDLVIAAKAPLWVADVGLWPWYLRWGSYLAEDVMPSRRFAGMHGYDPVRVPGVRAVFYAWGPRIAPGAVPRGMRSIDVHPTLAALLGIAPGEPVDGEARQDILRAAGAEDDAGVAGVLSDAGID